MNYSILSPFYFLHKKNPEDVDIVINSNQEKRTLFRNPSKYFLH